MATSNRNHSGRVRRAVQIVGFSLGVCLASDVHSLGRRCSA